MMPDSGDEMEAAASHQHDEQQLQAFQTSSSAQQAKLQQGAEQLQQQLPQQLQVVTHPPQHSQPQQPQQPQQPPSAQPQQPQYIPHIADASVQQRRHIGSAQQQQQAEQRLLVAQQQQHEQQQRRQQQQEQELQTADAKFQAAEALNNAFCRNIYSTALQHLQQQCATQDLEQQFLDILDRDDPFDQPCTVAHQDTNSCKNRYRDVVPYDHNRVCLPPPPPPAAAAARPCGGSSSSSSAGGAASAATVPGDGGSSAAAAAAAAACAAAACAAGAAAGKAALGLGGCSSSSSSSNYINASFMSDPQVSGDHAALQGYIATQGPLPDTVSDFWRMVAATNTSAIVMLTGLSDGSPKLGNSKPRCAAYFPEKEQDVLRLPGCNVTCVHKTSLDENVHFRQLEVVWSEPVAAPAAASQAAAAAAGAASSTAAAGAAAAATRQQQQQLPQPPQPPQRLWINHYQYAGWPDYGVPPTTASVLELCHALDGCRRAGCKIVVHCSAGVGRTGTFIAVDVLLQRLHSLSLRLHGSVAQRDVVAAMNVPELVVALRQQRRGTVQTWEQYSFIWQAVVDELQSLLQEQEQQPQEQQPPPLDPAAPQQQEGLAG